MPYVFAGSETLLHFLNNRGNEYFSNTFYEEYIRHINNNYLVTYGTALSKKKHGNLKKLSIPGKYNKSILKSVFQKDYINRGLQMRDPFRLFIDSGGFQATMGYLDEEEVYLFIDEYARFLEQNSDNYSYAFTLDLLFIKGNLASSNKLLEINDYSFSKLASLPEYVRKKLIFIYHFRTPNIFKVWKEITKKYENKFSNYFSMGGIVAMSSTAKATPIHLYTIPLVYIIRNAIKQGLKNFNVHVLGGATYKDVLFYKIITKVVKYFHNLDITISYDSSAPFKQFQVARCCDIVQNDFIINTISIKEDDIMKKISGLTNGLMMNEYLKQKYKEMLDILNPTYSNVLKRPFYVEAKPGYNTLSKDIGLVGMLYVGYLYKVLEESCEKFVNDIFPLYTSGRQAEFFDRILEKMIQLNRNKYSPKLKSQYRLDRTLKVIQSLDVEYIDYIVDSFLGAEELIDSDEVEGFSFL